MLLSTLAHPGTHIIPETMYIKPLRPRIVDHSLSEPVFTPFPNSFCLRVSVSCHQTVPVPDKCLVSHCLPVYTPFFPLGRTRTHLSIYSAVVERFCWIPSLFVNAWPKWEVKRGSL